MKRTALKARTKPPRKVNPKRRKSEFARCYHSKERVRFVKSLGCIYCSVLSPFFGIQTVGSCHNAHTENGGRGRKGDYNTIIPLCPTHHRLYDGHLYPFDKSNQSLRDGLKNAASEVERMWQEHNASAAA